MKGVKICYSIRDNIGDAINPYIVSELLGYDPIHADPYHCEITGIGSGLGRFFFSASDIDPLRRVKKETLRVIYSSPVILWSAGFIRTPGQHLRASRKNILPAAVRGQLSLDAVKEVLTINSNDVVKGDAGLLAAELIKPKEKKYTVGFIPHDSERNETKYIQLCENTPGSVIIDVRSEVRDCLEKISACQAIVSSSLHGLVIADGMNIPNRQAILTNKLAGDGFKFRDYYSGYGIAPDPLNLNEINTINIYDITDHWKIDKGLVNEKKEQLVNAFKKFL